MGRSPPRRSRSRGKGGGSRRDYDRTSTRDRRGSDTGRRGSDAGRDQGRRNQGRSQDDDRAPREGRSRANSGASDPGEKTGKQKAKEAMEREREKARLKRQERENNQKQKEQNKVEQREKKREDALMAIDHSVEESAAKAAKEGRSPPAKLKIAAQSAAEQKSEAAKAMTAAEKAAEAAKNIASRLSKSGRQVQVDEPSARKLFELMDRSGKGQVSQRDVLVALRKHHAVRQLFGLAGAGGEEASVLEKRLLAIQEAFESGSGLGEVAPAFKELKEASSVGQAFEWEPFFSACSTGSLQARALEAVVSLPREHSHGAAFVATNDWTLVPPGAACPPGLEYRMDMDTGQTLARLPQKKKAA